MAILVQLYPKLGHGKIGTAMSPNLGQILTKNP